MAEKPDWLLIVDDVFPRWRICFDSSQAVRSELEAMLCDPDTNSAMHRVDASGVEIPGTARFLGSGFCPGFWPDRLVVTPDPDGGDQDGLVVNYAEPADFYSPGGHWKFYVAHPNIERWERMYFSRESLERLKKALALEASAGAETRAIAHLKSLLEVRGDAMSKDEARKACEQFVLTGAGFDDRVWPAARQAAGLPAIARPGRKKRQPADIESEVDRVIGPKKSGRKSSR